MSTINNDAFQSTIKKTQHLYNHIMFAVCWQEKVSELTDRNPADTGKNISIKKQV